MNWINIEQLADYNQKGNLYKKRYYNLERTIGSQISLDRLSAEEEKNTQKI